MDAFKKGNRTIFKISDGTDIYDYMKSNGKEDYKKLSKKNKLWIPKVKNQDYYEVQSWDKNWKKVAENYIRNIEIFYIELTNEHCKCEGAL